MTNERYNFLMSSDECKLTDEEWKEGWHFCEAWDFLLVGPGMSGELRACKCLDPNHPVYKTIEPLPMSMVDDNKL